MVQSQSPYMVALQKNDPKLGELLTTSRELIITDGALSAKVKTLMTMPAETRVYRERPVLWSCIIGG